MSKLLLFLLLSFTNTIWSQENYNTSNITVTPEDLQTSTYNNDSTANAFYIFEKGFSRIQDDGSFNLLTDYSAKIKILNKEGYSHATIKIKLYKSPKEKEKISKLEAYTYSVKTGTRTSKKLDPTKVFTEENKDYDLIIFTFPSISPGAVLVYSYQKESPFIFNYEPWYFQSDIPKLHSRYETSIPGNYNYNIKIVGNLKLDDQFSDVSPNCFKPTPSSSPGDCVIGEYTMKNIPAFKEESYLTSRNNYISKIEFELTAITNLDGTTKKYTKTWKDVDKELQNDKNLGKQLKRTSLVKGLLPENIQKENNSLEKAKAIFEFVKKNYTWNGEYRIFQDMNLKDILNDKTGNISSVNILLHNIYEEQDFKVFPVISSTRANGVPTKLYPVLSEFNYIMLQLQIGDKKYLLDATEKNANFDEVPFRSLNSYARLLDFGKESTWIDIEPHKLSGLVFIDSLKINEDGTAKGVSQQIFKGYHALQARNALEKLTNEEIFNKISSPSNFTRSSNTSIVNKDAVSEALQIKHELQNQTQKINKDIYLNPFSFKFFSKNPFQLANRNYPVDFGYMDSFSYFVHLEIPQTHQFKELPEQKILRLPESGGMLQFFVQQVDESNVSVQFRFSFAKASYSSSYYPVLKEFLERIIEVETQSIILIQENL